MTDIPIIFSAPMVRALLDGRKTMTRRLAWRPMTEREISARSMPPDCKPTLPSSWLKMHERFQASDPGYTERLWVREAWRADRRWDTTKPRDIQQRSSGPIWFEAGYLAGHYESRIVHCQGADFDAQWSKGRERRSIHMPRWASRLTLIVTATKIEPLLDISEEDARAEGFEDGQLDDGFGPREIGGGYTIESPGTFCSAAGMFQVTWQKLHPEWDGFSSPEVVALTFTVHQSNIDALEVAAA